MSSWMVPGYADVRELGRGPVGRTVLAHHAPTGAPAVIRYLADELSGDEAVRQRYRDLARALAGRDAPHPNAAHPNAAHLVAVYEYVESDAGVAVVREYVTGASLRVLLAEGAMKPEVALTVLKGGLLGLAAPDVAHGAVHADNVLVHADGRVGVADAGLAVAASGASTATREADVAAVTALFVAALAGGRAAGPDRVPRRLRGLLPVLATGSGEAAASELDAVARRAYGSDWETHGRERLARLAARHAGRDAGRGRSDR